MEFPTYNGNSVTCLCGVTIPTEIETTLGNQLRQKAYMNEEDIDGRAHTNVVCPSCDVQYNVNIHAKVVMTVTSQEVAVKGFVIHSSGYSYELDRIPFSCLLGLTVGDTPAYTIEDNRYIVPDGCYQVANKEYTVTDYRISSVWNTTNNEQMNFLEELTV